MDFHASSSAAISNSSCSLSAPTYTDHDPSALSSPATSFNRTEVTKKSLIIYKIISRVFLIIVTLILVLAGSVVGAITGALIGITTESGFFRGAGIGAISGALFSVDAVESSRTVFESNGLSVDSFLHMGKLIYSISSGRVVQEKVGLAVQTAMHNEFIAMDYPLIDLDAYETVVAKGMTKNEIDNLPKIIISLEDCRNYSGDNVGCAVCIQDFKVGETAMRLPHCSHIFHLTCIDGWLLRHGSCPLCRRCC